jgi:hypothetical protein
MKTVGRFTRVSSVPHVWESKTRVQLENLNSQRDEQQRRIIYSRFTPTGYVVTLPFVDRRPSYEPLSSQLYMAGAKAEKNDRKKAPNALLLSTSASGLLGYLVLYGAYI